MSHRKSLKDPAGEQYALQLFEETIGRKGKLATIVDAEQDLAFPKNNVFVDVSGIGVLTRRGLNVMNFLACDAPVDVVEFECDIEFFKFLLNYQSRNHKHLNEALREAQKASVVVTRERSGGGSGTEFVSIPLVGIVGVAGGKVYFKFDPAIRKLHKNPQGFTFLSLRTTSAFTSVFAHSLYEKLKSVAFKGSPTAWITVEEARKWTGADDAKFMQEWAEFRRRALLVAVNQINELSDLHVEVETKSSPGSKKVTHLRFVLSEQEGTMVQSLRQTEARKAIYQMLRGEFGLGSAELNAITQDEKYTLERIEAAIGFVRHRMAHGGKKVRLPGRLLLKALEEGWAVPSAELAPAGEPRRLTGASPAPVAAPSQDVSRDAKPGADPMEQQYQHEGQLGFECYLSWPQERQADARAAFARTVVFRALQRQLQRAKGPLAHEELLHNERLRLALGNHVAATERKAAPRKPASSARGQLNLIDAERG